MKQQDARTNVKKTSILNCGVGLSNGPEENMKLAISVD